MRRDTAWYVLVQILFVCLPIARSESKCQVEMTDKDFTNGDRAYFRYCANGRVLTRQTKSGIHPTCQSGDKLKLVNFHPFVSKNAQVKCSEPFNKLRYKYKLDTGCLRWDIRDDIARPFLAALSGRTVRQMKASSTAHEISVGSGGGFGFKQITLDMGCETHAADQKVDMCQAGSKVFNNVANVSLRFVPRTFHADMEATNHNSTGCYCYFKTFNTSRQITVRGLDVRLQDSNRLSLDSVQLSPSRVYWWQSGVLSEGLAVLTLTGLSLNELPHSVWLDINGENMNITCDTKPLVVEGLVTSTPQKFASSSTGGLNMIYIIIIVISAIVFLIIVIVIAKFFQLRFSDGSQSGAYKVDDPDASETFISSTYEKGDDAPSPRDSVVVYSKVDNSHQHAVLYSQPVRTGGGGGGGKSRKGGESDENRHLYESDSETDLDVSGDNSVLGGTEHKFSHDAVVHDRPQDTPKTPTTADCDVSVYNHFPDHPDVIPTNNCTTFGSTTTDDPYTNIYNTTSAGIYSSPHQHQPQRQRSQPADHTYDVA